MFVGSIDDFLTDIIDRMENEKVSLRALLEKLFTSTIHKHREFVNRFYKNDGPSTLVKRWTMDLENKQHFDTLVKTAADIVVKQGQKELSQLSRIPELRHPANDIQLDTLENFTLDFLQQRFEESGPLILRVLTGLATANAKKLNSPSTVIVMCSILLFLRSQKSDHFQMMMGLYLYSGGCSSGVMDVLSKVGISVSRMSVHEALKGVYSEEGMITTRNRFSNYYYFYFQFFGLILTTTLLRNDKVISRKAP